MNREQRLNSTWPEWEPMPWDVAEPEAEAQRAGYDVRALWPIVWLPLAQRDWPAGGLFTAAPDGLTANEMAYFARHEGEDLVLIKRLYAGWPDPPLYGFASRAAGRTDLGWSHWGSFDFPPEAWRLPEADKVG